MKRLVVALVVLVAAAVGLVHFFPEQVEPWLGGTPLKDRLGTSTPVYQWRDAQGQWQVTDRPPPRGIPYEVKAYPLDANILPSREPDRD